MPVNVKHAQSVIRRLSRLLGKTSREPRPEHVHQLRTHVRRVEVLLTHVVRAPGSNERKLTKTFDRLRKRTGKVRDLDVQLATLAKLRVPAGVQKQRLESALTDLRSRHEKKLLEKLDKDSISKLRKHLRKFSGNLSAQKNHENPLTMAQHLVTSLARRQTPLTEPALHAYRLEAKRARYLAEMAGSNPAANALIEKLVPMQDSLGSWHDSVTLCASAQKILGGVTESALVAELKNLTRARLREAIASVEELRNSTAKPASLAKEMPAPRSALRKPSQSESSKDSAAIA